MLAETILQTVVERSLISAAALEAARDVLAGNSGSAEAPQVVLDHLYATAALSPDAVLAALSERYGIPVLPTGELRSSPEARTLLNAHRARAWQVLPLSVSADEVQVAVSDPHQWDAVDQWAQLLGRAVDLRLADAGELRHAIEEAYSESESADAREQWEQTIATDSSGAVSPQDAADAPVDSPAQQVPVVRYVHTLIAEALRKRASDIHLEPMEECLRVRFRIDGRLQVVKSPPRHLQASILSRLKLMADISIAEKRLPQDGRIRFPGQGREIDLRVSSVPSVFGESLVMRVHDRAAQAPGLAELGFSDADRSRFEKLIDRPDGLILVTGPTGSGKSTTLYAALRHLNESVRKIITVEDPVEHRLAGVNQVQVQRASGMDFAAALRAMLRQAPNVIMVGEIRDGETAEIAMNASLTGHLVFSTLHTNDATGAAPRLIDIGVKPFLIADSLRAVLAQRLVRTLCPSCRVASEPSPAERRALDLPMRDAGRPICFRGQGCVHCSGIGFRGRRGIFELLEVSPAIAELIHRQASLPELRREARAGGMQTMREDGRRQVLAGLTTPGEVLAVAAN